MSGQGFDRIYNDPTTVELAKEFVPMVNEDPEGARRALAIALRYGGIDGGHHRQWLVDQLIRCITGEHYQEFVEKFNHPDYDDWDEGIAP